MAWLWAPASITMRGCAITGASPGSVTTSTWIGAVSTAPSGTCTCTPSSRNAAFSVANGCPVGSSAVANARADESCASKLAASASTTTPSGNAPYDDSVSSKQPFTTTAVAALSRSSCACTKASASSASGAAKTKTVDATGPMLVKRHAS